MFRWPVVLLLALSMNSAVTNSANAATRATAVATVASAGVSFGYPNSWVAYALTKQGASDQQQTFTQQDPKLAEVYGVFAPTESIAKETIALYAVDLDAAVAGRFGSTVEVALYSANLPRTLDQFTSSLGAEYEGSGISVLHTSSVKIGARIAYRDDVRSPYFNTANGTAIKGRSGELLIPLTGHGYVNVSVNSSDDAAGIATINSILHSVRRT